jgi:hypothetical protein
MYITLQNSDEVALPEDFNKIEVVDLNLRSSKIEKLEGNFPELKTLDLRKTGELKLVNIVAPNLQTLFLTGSAVEELYIESSKLVDINLQLATNLKCANIVAPNLEHIALKTENSEKFVLNRLQNFPKLKGLNNIYKDQGRPLSKFVREFHEIEQEVHSHQKEKSKDCSCSICKSFNL